MTESGKSAGSADSYIGSLISLTSKYEIRYEGVLYTINTEESTIGLQNVKSFGTEGRKKDGPQIPPNDKVYEYILFRGSDIKDLQVKSSPPTHTEQQIHNDPAIIQSNYPCPPSISSTSASVGVGEPSALPRTAYPVVLPSYQLETHFGSLGSPAFQNADGASMSMPMYWQAYYGSSSILPHAQQQSLPFQPPSTISVPLTLQNQSQLPEVQAPLSSSITNLSGRFVPPLIPTADVVPPNFSSDPTLASFATTSTTDKASSLYINASSMTSNLPHMPLLPSFSQDRNSVTVPLTGKVGSASTLIPPTQSLPHSASSIAASTSISLSTISPTLFTPAQLIPPGPTASLSTHKLYPDLNDMEGSITASSKPSNSISTPLLQGPLLPLPVSTQQLDESVGYSHSSNGEVGVSHDVAPQQHSMTQYTEEFDFIAMNEKFKKDEVWGYLGKAKQIKTEETEDNQVDLNRVDGQGFAYNPKLDTKPVYNKDEFFDTLSCNSLRGASNERIRFSERMKHDTETFGEFQERPYLGHGGRNIARGGIYRGSYNRGRGYGYGYGGRGRGGYMPI